MAGADIANDNNCKEMDCPKSEIPPRHDVEMYSARMMYIEIPSTFVHHTPPRQKDDPKSPTNRATDARSGILCLPARNCVYCQARQPCLFLDHRMDLRMDGRRPHWHAIPSTGLAAA